MCAFTVLPVCSHAPLSQYSWELVYVEIVTSWDILQEDIYKMEVLGIQCLETEGAQNLNKSSMHGWAYT